MANIISCSRRTDVPAFYTPWLVNRLRAGYCHTYNPFGGQVYRVSLRPEDVVTLVFWTRNPAPLLPHLDELDSRGYVSYFHFTVLGYPHTIETHSPALRTSLQTFQKLSDRLSPDRVRWRYDPILFSSITPPDYHLERFAAIARALEGYTRHCTFSFTHFYAKTRRNLDLVSRETGVQFFRPSLPAQQDLVRQLVTIAGDHGMTLNSCCSDDLVIDGVFKNHCIDPELVRLLVPGIFRMPEAKPTRADCGCIASIDIGVYETCLSGCAYCYATNERQAALQRHASHDPSDSILWRPPHLLHQDLDAIALPLKEQNRSFNLSLGI